MKAIHESAFLGTLLRETQHNSLVVCGGVCVVEEEGDIFGDVAKADKMEGIPAGDKDGHVFMIQQGKCTTGKVKSLAQGVNRDIFRSR